MLNILQQLRRVFGKATMGSSNDYISCERTESNLQKKPSVIESPFVTSLVHGYASGWSGAGCVFVLSTGRVGTQTLTALLSLSSKVLARHEPEPRLIKASFDAYMENSLNASSSKWKELVLAARDDFVLMANEQGKVYVETNNRLTYLARALSEAFPASKFIHLHRHPYEVIRSAMRRRYYDNHAGDFARYRPRPKESLFAAWEELSILEKSAWYWSRVNADAMAFLCTLSESKKLVMKANNLFRGDENCLRDLFAFVDVEMPPMELIKQVLGKKLNAQLDGHYPPPSEWGAEELNSVRTIVVEVATTLGYEI